jgi:hypothetical protein
MKKSIGRRRSVLRTIWNVDINLPTGKRQCWGVSTRVSDGLIFALLNDKEIMGRALTAFSSQKLESITKKID